MFSLKKPSKKIVCFFCKVESKEEESFSLEYKAVDGNGKVEACPMCAGMLNDMMISVRETYESD
jgi:hypothetical protein